MTQRRLYTCALLLTGALVSGCAATPEQDLKDLDPQSMNDIMLNFADPTESVDYFSSALARNPNSPVLKRDMAASLARAGRFDEAAGYYSDVAKTGSMRSQDLLTYADALLRAGEWKAAEQQLAKLPPGLRNYERSRLSAILADIRKDWRGADRHYAEARSLTVQPASILNNWGVSKLSRGAFSEAEIKFREAVSFDREMFVAKNNLVIARGRQRNYQLPIIPMDETERAQLQHDLAVVALDNGDTEAGKSLLRQALANHPQHFEAAAIKLAAL